MIDKVREVALKVLYEIDKNEAYSNLALDELLNENRRKLNFDERDIGFISELVYGVITWKITLDEIIKKYSKIKLKKISPWIINILRMGIYQIVFLSKVPKSAAVNESVNLAKRYGHKSSSNFVNAILRKVTKEDYEELFEIKNDLERLSKVYSMPLWIIEELINNNKLTISEVEEICKNSNIRPKLSIRINKLKIENKEDLINILKAENSDIEIEDGILPDFITVKNMKNIENLNSFKNGLYTIQDEGAGLVSLILDPKENEKILDCCSSPGGKTTYIAEIIKDKGEIIANDVHEHRTKLVLENANRLGISSIKTNVQDAATFNKEYENCFDKILLDVPCLGIGVLKRKPDIKWKKQKEDIESISKIQYQILENSSKYLKNGGELVYSTCSILRDENENVISNFLQNNKNFEMIKINNILDKIEKNNKEKFFSNYLINDTFLEIYQNEKTDGFFICKLKKID